MWPARTMSPIGVDSEVLVVHTDSKGNADQNQQLSELRAKVGDADSLTVAAGDLIVLDFGGAYDGYCVDLTRTVSLGAPDERARHVYDAVAEAHAAGVAASVAGATVRDVDRAADALTRLEEAALAIGNSRLTVAFDLLCAFRERNILPAMKRMLLLPIALTRCESAFALLLDVVQNEQRENAAAAITGR